MVAMRLCIERLIPPRRDRPVTFELPAMEAASDAAAAMGAILKAVAAGDVTPDEAAGVAGLFETFRRTLELTEIEKRVRILEEQRDGKQN